MTYRTATTLLIDAGRLTDAYRCAARAEDWVTAARLAHEYGAEVRLLPANFYGARWISSEDAAELKRFIELHPSLIANDAAGVPAFLAPSKAELEVREERWTKIRFYTLREYSGLAEATG